MTEDEKLMKKAKLVYKALRKGTATFNYHPKTIPPAVRMLTLKYYLEDEHPRIHINPERRINHDGDYEIDDDGNEVQVTPDTVEIIPKRVIIELSNIHVFRDELEAYNFKDGLSWSQSESIRIKLVILIKKRFKESGIHMIDGIRTPNLIQDK
jgi:hypothetical protein